jgi:hypothetical protein
MAEGVFGVERDESWSAGWSAGRASREAELAVLRAQRDAALKLCDVAVTRIGNPAAKCLASVFVVELLEAFSDETRGMSLTPPDASPYGIRAALGVQPEPDNG